MEVVIKVFSSEAPCTRCKVAEDIVREVAMEFGEKVKVVKLSFPSEEAIKHGVSIIPSIVVNDELISSGTIPSKDELRRAIIRAVTSRRHPVRWILVER